MADWEIMEGDCRDVLRQMAAGSVHTVVTSPPYFGLRDYGTGEWEGGDPACDHVAGMARQDTERETPGGRGGSFRGGTVQFRDVCGRCSATRVDRQIGLEPTPDEFVAALVDVFREVRRVLRDDGTVWLNLGDSYNNRAVNRPSSHQGGLGFDSDHLSTSWRDHAASGRARMSIEDGNLKEKDLLGIPWMVAFALRADGWYLRSDIIWNKPNPMPESVTDRPTKSHEYLFLLSKGPRYFYDADAIREEHQTDLPVVGKGRSRDRHAIDGDLAERDDDAWGSLGYGAGGRNKRSVWTVATQPYAGAHFATFPPKLIEPSILAGAPERACGECGAPWMRVVERQNGKSWHDHADDSAIGQRQVKMGQASWDEHVPTRTLGFEPSCPHGDGTAAGVVLDPFAGAGTTGLEALRHNRSFVGIELNPAYATMARQRIEQAVRLGFRSPQTGPEQIPGQVALFDL